MGNFMIGDIYPSFLGWVEKIYCGGEQCWPKNDVKDTDVYCFNIVAWWCEDETLPGLPVNKDVVITGLQMKSGTKQHPFNECTVWMTSDFVLHITLDKLVASEDNHLYEYWKSKGHFETSEWHSYTTNEISIQLSVQDFQSVEYTPIDNFQYYQLLSTNPLHAFYDVYPASNVAFMYNSWDTATKWGTYTTGWVNVQNVPLTESLANENTTWRLKITEAADHTGLSVTATAIYNYNELQDFTKEHLWKELLEQAKLNPTLIFTDTFELKPKTRDLKIKIVILDEFGEQKRVDVNRTITLYKPMSADKSYGNWALPLYCASSATNINLNPIYRGTNAWIVIDHVESTRAGWVSMYNNVTIPISYLDEETPAETVTWYYQERIGFSMGIVTRVAGHSNLSDHGFYVVTPNNVYEKGTTTAYPISYTDRGDSWAFYLDPAILPEDQGATWNHQKCVFEPEDYYYGSAYIDGNTLVVPKSECSSYAGREIGSFTNGFIGTYDYNYVQVIVTDGNDYIVDAGWLAPDNAAKTGILPGNTWTDYVYCIWPASIITISATWIGISADEYKVDIQAYSYEDHDNPRTITYPTIYARRINGEWQWSDTIVANVIY